MFIRISQDFIEDFSIGLRVSGLCDYDLVAVRFQGPHGGQSATKDMRDMHNSYHIHQMTDDDLSVRRKHATYKEEASFSSYEEALCSFLMYCHIDDEYDIFSEEKILASQIRINTDC